MAATDCIEAALGTVLRALVSACARQTVLLNIEPVTDSERQYLISPLTLRAW